MLRNFCNTLNKIRSNLMNISLDSIKISLSIFNGIKTSMKRSMEGADSLEKEPVAKCSKIVERQSWFSEMQHGKGRLIPRHVFEKLTEDDLKLLNTVKTSCTDLNMIRDAIKLRKRYNLAARLPEDINDSDYYIEDGLRKVYPYPYLYQTYAKRRWVGRKLMTVLKQEFRDIPEDQLKLRFEMQRVLVNGEPVDHNYQIKDNDFIANRCHRHELPVLAAPIRVIHEDKDILVVDKPPSVPIHPCGRYRNNSVISILQKDYGYDNPSIKCVHRLDRLVSGVLLIARNTARAQKMEQMMKNRDVQKEYVCRVVGNFPDGKPDDDGFITVDKPLENVPGKIGITVVFEGGKQSLTKFKKLNYNGKTSAVLCQPKTGRMHQIRVHLQYLGHPIVNDGLYNCDSFGPERGKGARFGKTLRQLSNDVIAVHRAHTWMMTEENDVIDPSLEVAGINNDDASIQYEAKQEATAEFLDQNEREETLAALGHFFTDESWRDMEKKRQYKSEKHITDSNCRDCCTKYHDPPLRRMFLYLHALRYSGIGWCYESDMPAWACSTWKY